MLYAIIMACSLSASDAPCPVALDTLGPYADRAECVARTHEMFKTYGGALYDGLVILGAPGPYSGYGICRESPALGPDWRDDVVWEDSPA